MTKLKADQYEVTLDRVPFPGEPPIKQVRYVGDGKAVDRPGRGEPTWMNFTGAKVDVPTTDEPWFDTRVHGKSTKHRHSDACLRTSKPGVDDAGQPIDIPVTGGPKAVTGGLVEVPEPGWYVCSARPGTYVHDHGNGEYAHHMSGDWRGGCPPLDDLPWA